MKIRPALLLLLASPCFLGGCLGALRDPATPSAPREPLTPSPRLVVGRIIAVDAERGFAVVELAGDAPPAALAEGGELLARSFDELRETARLIASRYLRGRTLGTSVKTGRPSPGDEVVWIAP
jgi:hypothetical protein